MIQNPDVSSPARWGSGLIERLHADQTLSLSDFKRNPSAALRAAGGRPLAVLNHNRVSFYVVDPALFEALVQPRPGANAGHLIPIEALGPETPENPVP